MTFEVSLMTTSNQNGKWCGMLQFSDIRGIKTFAAQSYPGLMSCEAYRVQWGLILVACINYNLIVFSWLLQTGYA